jgi:hypothetical protein
VVRLEGVMASAQLELSRYQAYEFSLIRPSITSVRLPHSEIYGSIFQIDTPYLDSQSNGLSTLIDRIKKHPLYAHVRLEKGERSELANLANELL